MQRVLLEIFFPLPEGWGLCQSYEVLIAQADTSEAPHERGLEEYPQDWQEDYHRLSSLVFELAEVHGDNILIRLLDPRSLQGLIKSIRYQVRRYPTFIINGQKKIVGWDTDALMEMVASDVEVVTANP